MRVRAFFSLTLNFPLSPVDSIAAKKLQRQLKLKEAMNSQVQSTMLPPNEQTLRMNGMQSLLIGVSNLIQTPNPKLYDVGRRIKTDLNEVESDAQAYNE